MNIIGFNSMLEASFGKMTISSNSLLNSIRLKHENNWYLVGEACKNLGKNPHRLVNSRPEEVDYQVLLLASLLMSSTSYSDRISLTLGFPFSTYNSFKVAAEKLLSVKNFVIEYDTSLFKKDPLIEKKLIEIENLEIVPELAGCAIALKKHLKVPEANFLLVSVGFGTIEIGLVTSDGLNQRTVISVPGVIRCIQNLRVELEKEHFIGFINDHQLDEAFKKGSLILNRVNVNVKNQRSNILKSFYREYISDTIRAMISDRDFEKMEKIYVCGGGAYYEEIRDSFKTEFEKVLPVEILNEPDTLASIGYYYNSQRFINTSSTSSPVGIDIGNSSTYIVKNEDI